MPFADVFSGFEGAASDHYSKLLEMQYGQRRDIAASIAKMADDPRFDEAASMALKHRALDIIGGDPMKPVSSKESDISQILMQPPAPPPVKAPGGQGAQNMPIGQDLFPGLQAPQHPPSLGAVQGGVVPPISQPPAAPGTAPSPPPQASPNTGPSGQIADQTIQAPAPPPRPVGMMPYQQQLERLHGKTVAETKYPPMKVSSVKSMDEDGKIYDYATYAGVNPSTGEYGTWQIKSDQPVAYAPRAAVGAAINSEDEAKLRAAGLSTTLNNPTPEQIQHVNQILPGARLVPTGYGSFYIASQTYRPESYNGMVNAMPSVPPIGQPASGAVPLGQANSTLPKIRVGQQVIPLPGGRLGTATTQSQTSTQLPGAAAPPQPPPQAPVAAPNDADTSSIPPAPRGLGFYDGEPKVINPAALAYLTQANRGLSAQEAEGALRGAGWAPQGSAAPQQAPAAAPTPPPGAKLTPGETKEIPGAGHGLSAQQVLTVQKQGSALTNTVERMTNVLSKADLLKSLVTAGKVAFAVDPSQSKLLISRMTGLTADETSLAKDYASLSEDINILRTVYGIAPSRGQQAFQALQLQKGALLGDVGVFKGTLQNTLKSVVDQMTPMNQQLAPAKQSIPFSSGIAKAYLLMNGMDREKARAAATKDGWQVP